MVCALNNKETSKPVIKLRLEPKKRKKRDLEEDKEEESKRDKKSDKTKTTKTKITKIPVYGCPKNYERIIAEGIDLCFRFGEDKATKKDLIIEFDEAKKHCEEDGATLLYFSNYNEALNIWKWLGKTMNTLAKISRNAICIAKSLIYII